MRGAALMGLVLVLAGYQADATITRESAPRPPYFFAMPVAVAGRPAICM